MLQADAGEAPSRRMEEGTEWGRGEWERGEWVGEALEVQNECRRGLNGMRVRSQSKCLVLM